MINKANTLYTTENQGSLLGRNKITSDSNRNSQINNPSFKASLAGLQSSTNPHTPSFNNIPRSIDSFNRSGGDLRQDDFLLATLPGRDTEENIDKDRFVADLKQHYGYSLDRLDDEIKAYLVRSDFDLIKTKEFAISFYQDASLFSKDKQNQQVEAAQGEVSKGQLAQSELAQGQLDRVSSKITSKDNKQEIFNKVHNQQEAQKNDQQQQLEILSQILSANPPQTANQNLDSFLTRFAENTKYTQKQPINNQAKEVVADKQEDLESTKKQSNDFRTINFESIPRYSGQSQMPYGSIESKIIKQKYNQKNSNTSAINNNDANNFGSTASLKLDLDYALSKYEQLI